MDKKVRDKLLELEQSANEYWNIPPEVGKFINILVKARSAKRILELGTSNGYSTIWLALAARETGGKIISVEYFEERVAMARANFEYCDISDIITVKQGKILELLPDFSCTFDFIFIDANKSEYIEYFKKLESMIERGGLIVSDNIISHYEDVTNYVEYSTDNENFDSVLIPMSHGLMLHYRR